MKANINYLAVLLIIILSATSEVFVILTDTKNGDLSLKKNKIQIVNGKDLNNWEFELRDSITHAATSLNASDF